jgi:hypothetical protein
LNGQAAGTFFWLLLWLVQSATTEADLIRLAEEALAEPCTGTVAERYSTGCGSTGQSIPCPPRTRPRVRQETNVPAATGVVRVPQARTFSLRSGGEAQDGPAPSGKKTALASQSGLPFCCKVCCKVCCRICCSSRLSQVLIL